MRILTTLESGGLVMKDRVVSQHMNMIQCWPIINVVKGMGSTKIS